MSQLKSIRALKLFILSLTLVAIGWHWSNGARVGAQGQPPAADAPVEQTRKNIQVLKGLPESQLFPLMNYISVSLGVRCGFCHVQGAKDPKTGRDQWDWASDEKEHKLTARRMMLMTMSINKTNKLDLGSTGVTCFTCHRGANDPVNLPALPLAVSGHEPPPGPPQGGQPQAGAGTPAGAAPAAAPQPRPSPPTAQQVIDKYIAAVGGQAAVAKVQTRVLTGTREASQNRVFPIEITLKGTDKFLVVANTQQGAVKQSYNGATGWIMNAQGQHAATADELAALKTGAASLSLLQITAPPPGERVGRGRVGERAAHVLIYNPKPGVTERLFFDAETGLLLRKVTLTETVLNPIPEQIDFEDYREVDGVKVPFTIRVSNIDTFFSSTRKFTEIKFNAPVDDALFQAPAKQ